MIVKVNKVAKSTNWSSKDHKTQKLMPIYDNCEIKIVPGLNAITGELRIGITPTEQTEFEELLQMDPGSLRKTAPFWSSFYIAIPGGGLTLNTESPLDKLKYAVLKADPTVCQSMAELRTHATAEYLMTSEDMEAKVSNTKRKVKLDAGAVFSKLTQDEVVNALVMFGQYAGNVDPEVARDRLGDVLDKNPAQFLKVVGDKLFKDKVWMLKAIKAGVIRKGTTGSGTNQPLYYNDTMLGTGLEEAIAFIKDKENSAIVLGIKKALK